jgi:co-chaperonin GroES (HSP10)
MITPLNNNLVAKLFEQEKKGTLILTIQQEKKYTFEIVSVGENKQGLKVGDKVIVDKYSFKEMEIDGQLVYFINCDLVIGKFDD